MKGVYYTKGKGPNMQQKYTEKLQHLTWCAKTIKKNIPGMCYAYQQQFRVASVPWVFKNSN